MDRYCVRHVDRVLERLLGELPALLIVGPRASGKTTTASRYARTIVRLDREAEAAAFRADPDAALRKLEEPVLLDEWQAVPGVLGAVKRLVDHDPTPGRFLITGSVRAQLDSDMWPGTGRLVRVSMYGLTIRERLGRASVDTFFDRLLAGDGFATPSGAPDLVDYIEKALEGAFPEVALRLAGTARQAWLESYVEQLLTRDARQVDVGRDEARLRRYFEAYALNSAGVVADKTLYEAARVNRRTGLAYEQLLESLLVVQAIPAWVSNRLKRLVLSPKRYLVDPALAAGALGLDARAVLRDGDLLGRMLDTFVVAQLRGELSASLSRARLYHLRQEQGRHEIDVLAELGGDRVVAVEVKATAAPRKDDARHLAWLRDRLEDRFAGGVVFHTGPRAYVLDDRIGALPICALWSGAA